VRICTVAEEPLPTITTVSGSLPSACRKTSSTWLTVACPLSPTTGIDIVVPPLKSMPKVNPRTRMLSTAIATMTPLTVYHSRRRPMTSKAPVPL
jgi:hypothetical protein